VAKLIAQSAAQGLLPRTIGSVTLSEPQMPSLTSIAPFAGTQDALSKTLKAEHGLDWPEAGQTTRTAEARLIWVGMDMAFLAGAEPSLKLAKHAALTDQSDAWAMLSLQGADATQVLARLVPADLRESQFKTGQTLRSNLGHMQMVLIKDAPVDYSILVFRSMAATAVHELESAMSALAKRRAL